MSFMVGALCAMCLRGVHYKEGRVACDGCDLPTDCCPCESGQQSEMRPRALPASGRSSSAGEK